MDSEPSSPAALPADGAVFDDAAVSDDPAVIDDAAVLLAAGPVLLYDGECGVCSRSVQWILAHERKHTLRFASLESAIGQSLIKRGGVPRGVDSVLWVEGTESDVRVRMWSGSVLAALDYVGGPWRALTCLRIVPRPLRDACYRLFARHRQKVAPRTCLLPPANSRTRFLDT